MWKWLRHFMHALRLCTSLSRSKSDKIKCERVRSTTVSYVTVRCREEFLSADVVRSILIG